MRFDFDVKHVLVSGKTINEARATHKYNSTALLLELGSYREMCHRKVSYDCEQNIHESSFLCTFLLN